MNKKEAVCQVIWERALTGNYVTQRDVLHIISTEFQ
jgi:hypothetical protein